MSALRGIVLKNSFWGDERNFLELLIRIERGDVRDHIDLSKNRPRTFVAALNSDAAAEKSKNYFREIFRAVRFSTFATQSGARRKSLMRRPTSEFDLKQTSCPSGRFIGSRRLLGLTATDPSLSEQGGMT